MPCQARLKASVAFVMAGRAYGSIPPTIYLLCPNSEHLFGVSINCSDYRGSNNRGSNNPGRTVFNSHLFQLRFLRLLTSFFLTTFGFP